MTKVVINSCFGGFGLSEQAIKRYWGLKGKEVWFEYGLLNTLNVWLVPPAERLEIKEGKAFYDMSLEERQAYNHLYAQQTWYDREVGRDDPVLVQVVEELGDKANGRFADLRIVEIPDGVNWGIEEYDGNEHIAESHRTWY